MGIRDFLMRKMVEQKLKDVPKEEQEKILAMVQKNPEFFQKIALEIQEATKGGKDQMQATMEVMQKYQDDIRKMMG